ncbi:MAG: hypothetical protein ACPG77_18965, partial [Nannocystaceae bacterium]
CIQNVIDTVEGAFVTPDQVVTPGILGEEDVHIGPFPEACDSFLPVPIGVIPVNKTSGRGPIWTTNCLDN